MRRVVLVALSLVLFSGALAVAPGQEALPRASWGLHGAIALPVGASHVLDPGYQGTGFVEVPWPTAFRTLRLEAIYTALPYSVGIASDSLGQPLGELHATVRLRAIALNLILRRSDQAVVRPYLVAGAGVFRVDFRTEGLRGEVATSAAVNRVGGNAGLGFETYLRRVTLFAEARYHTVLHREDQVELRFVPVTFGVRVR
jgi:hypothetical protein